MKRLAILLLFLLPSIANAQGVRVGDNYPITSVQTTGGVIYSVPNARVNFCNYPANAVPCSNKATTYTDITLGTPCSSSTQITLTGTSNCVGTTDAEGNWGVWVAAGQYSFTVTLPGGSSVGPYWVVIASGGGGGSTVSINGTPITLPNFISSTNVIFSLAASNISATLSGIPTLLGNNNFSGTNNFNGVTNANDNLQSGNVPIKPASSASIRFISYNGNDNNDGLSLGSAKLSIEAAGESLPGGSTSPPTYGNGTIYVLDGNQGSSCPLLNPYVSPAVGLGFIGSSSDPNFSNPPHGWAIGGHVAIIGLSASSDAALGVGKAKTCVTVLGTAPAQMIAINGTDIDIENIKFPQSSQPGQMGIDSSGSGLGYANSGAAAIRLVNDAVTTTPTGSNGPTWKIGEGVFQVLMQDDTWGADYNQTPGTDAGANILFPDWGPGAEASFGFVILNNWWYGGGGVKYYCAHTFCTITTVNLSIENSLSTNQNPAVWFADSGINIGSNIYAIQLQDYTNTVPAVRNDSGNPEGLSVTNVHGQNIDTQGAMNVVGITSAEDTQAISPLRQGQTGLFGASLVGSMDITQRMFAPSAVRFSNLATTNAASWTNSGNTTFTTGITAPDGTTGAGQFVSTSGSQFGYPYPLTSQPLSIGDEIVAMAFVRSQTANGYEGGRPMFIEESGNAVLSCNTTNPIVSGDGQWDVVKETCIVTTGSTGSNLIALYVNYDATHTLQLYAPVFNYIATGTISANEAYAYANSLTPYDHSCAVGTVCGISGKLSMIGSITSTGVLKGSGLTETAAALSGTTDAISPHTSADYFITSTSADNATLAAPTSTTDDGVTIVITATTAHAHTITATSLLVNGGTGVPYTTASFVSSHSGSSITLRAYQGLWYVIAVDNVGLS